MLIFTHKSSGRTIIESEVLLQAAGTQPTGNRAASLGEQHPEEERQQSSAHAGMQRLAQLEDPQRQLGGQLPSGHPWLSCWRQGCVVPLSWQESRFSPTATRFRQQK